ncbi:MAG: TonB-dependent siderophore receptor [Alcanivorax sp.]|uniref:TonB-dependent siderophore receptor n=1 Tax=Alcanivorax sp. TaxID=1872427 RepID=UPI003DA6DDDD
MTVGSSMSAAARRPLAVPLSALCLSVSLAVSQPTQAQEVNAEPATQNRTEARQYNITAQSLGEALIQFGQQSDLEVTASSALVSGKQGNAINGRLSSRQALRELLAGTGLTYRLENGMVTLRQEKANELSAVTVSTSWQTATSAVEGYTATRSATGTKTDTPIIETAASVQVVPRDIIDEQQAINLKDVYENISGVQQAGNTLNAQSEVLPIIRGFESPVLLRNGLRATSAGAVDLVNVERVEVLKGPASILYGALEPGGVVSYVTKRPEAESRLVLGQQIGSDAFRRTTLDSTGALDEDSTVMYRLNLARTDSDSFRDDIELERTTVAPSLLWFPSDNTEVLFDFAYTKEEQPYDSGIPLSAEGKTLVPDSTFFGDDDLSGRENKDYYASYQLTHRLNPTWTLRNQVQFHRADNRNESLRHRAVFNNDTELSQRYQNEDRVEDELQFVLDGIATFHTDKTDHEVLIGVEHIKQETEWQRFRQNAPAVPIVANPNVNFDPPANQTLSDEPSDTRRWALYLQDQISLLEDGRLKALLGVRYDDVLSTGSQNDVESPDVDDSAFTARGGLLYMLNDQHSVYASASQSFQPQQSFAVDRSGTPLDPETGEQLEVGFKSGFSDRLSTTVSVYQLEKDDVAVFDQELFANTGDIAYFPGVNQRSRGAEIDITGQLTDRVKLLANYSYTDTEVLENEGDPSQKGERLGGASLHLARLWLSYDFTGPLAGLGLGGGARYVGESTAQFDTDLPLDAYTVADASLWYQWKNLRANLKVNNLFDEEYIPRANNAAIAHPGAPRSVLAGVSIEF